MQTVIDYPAIGKRVRFARMKQNMSQETLAEQSHLTIVHISNIENGHTKLSLPALIKIANALNVSVDELLTDNLRCFQSDIDKDARDILADCSEWERSIIIENMTALKASLRKK